MIGHQVPFFDLAFLALRELAEYTAQVPSDLPKQQLLAVLWREHDMVLALPCRVVQVIFVGIEIGGARGDAAPAAARRVAGRAREFLIWRDGLARARRGFEANTRSHLMGRELEIARGWLEAGTGDGIAREDRAFVEESLAGERR